MTEIKFSTKELDDAVTFIKLYIKEGYIVSAAKHTCAPRVISRDGSIYVPALYEYLIVATKED